ncbi:MAG: hypothetical protein OEL75_02765, partial [Kiritimatiellaceae bacterium]|nr:hypothetical protein [Kiritimatiellaceae bacterium]
DNVRSMLLDESVRVELSGMAEADVCLIERKVLRDGSVVWMMDSEGKLRICPVEVIRGYADQAMIRFEFAEDWKLVTSNMSAPVDGMELKTHGKKPDEKQEARP